MATVVACAAAVGADFDVKIGFDSANPALITSIVYLKFI